MFYFVRIHRSFLPLQLFSPPIPSPRCALPGQNDLWAPELHFFQGRWHIFASHRRSEGKYYRMFALRSRTNSLFGPYEYLGPLNAVAAIDPHLFKHQGNTYITYSQFLYNSTGRFIQCIYLAPLISATQIGEPRVRLSCPVYSWEQQGASINEGPQIITRNGRTFLIYSASGAWSADYSLGMLTLKRGAEGSILSSASWTKSKNPVFKKAPSIGIYGPGHNSFTRGPNGEYLMVYHTKRTTEDSFEMREVHAKEYTWNKKGAPVFGTPPKRTYFGPINMPRRGTKCPAQSQSKSRKRNVSSGGGDVLPLPSGKFRKRTRND